MNNYNLVNTDTDVAKRLDINKKTLQKELRSGKLKGYKKCRRWFILEKDLIEWITS